MCVDFVATYPCEEFVLFFGVLRCWSKESPPVPGSCKLARTSVQAICSHAVMNAVPCTEEITRVTEILPGLRGECLWISKRQGLLHVGFQSMQNACMYSHRALSSVLR